MLDCSKWKAVDSTDLDRVQRLFCGCISPASKATAPSAEYDVVLRRNLVTSRASMTVQLTLHLGSNWESERGREERERAREGLDAVVGGSISDTRRNDQLVPPKSYQKAIWRLVFTVNSVALSASI